MIKDRFIAMLLAISLLFTCIGGLCDDVHAESACPDNASASCSARDSKFDKAPCSPDSDHQNDGHCDDCCSCPCHTSSQHDSIIIKHSPLVESLIFFEPFSAVPEIVIPKFVPPESLA